MKKEDLISRKEFFKNAAKATLPFLGAIAMITLPSLAKASEAEEPMDCGYICSGGCKSGCGRSCSMGCSGSCSGNCMGSCKGACSRSCSYSCSGGCSGTCSSMSRF